MRPSTGIFAVMICLSATGALRADWPMIQGGLDRRSYCPGTSYTEQRLRWNVKIPQTFSAPIVSGGKVYVAIKGRGIDAFDAKSGRQIWSHPVNVAVCSPVVDRSKLYFLDDTGSLVALNTVQNMVGWKVHLGVQNRIVLGIHNGLIIADDGEKNIIAVDSKTRKIVWKQELFHTGYFALAGESLYGAVPEGLLGINLAKGERLGPWPMASVLTVIGAGQNIAVVQPHTVQLFDPTNNRTLWSWQAPEDMTPLLAANSTRLVCISVLGTVYGLDLATGENHWTFPTAAAITQPPVMTDEMVMFAAENNRLYSLQASSGQELFHQEGLSGVDRPFAFTGDILYACSHDGGLSAYIKRSINPLPTPKR